MLESVCFQKLQEGISPYYGSVGMHNLKTSQTIIIVYIASKWYRANFICAEIIYG